MRGRGYSERDISRAHWQRSVGNVAMSYLADRLLESAPKALESSELEFHKWFTREIMQRHGIGEVWARAYVLSMEGLSTRDLTPPEFDPQLENEASTYTFMGSIPSAFKEGISAQQIFPINLAGAVSKAALANRVNGFAVVNLSSIAAIFRRPDFQALIDQSALTKNGVWGTFAISIGDTYYPPHKDSPELEFVFNNGKVSFHPTFSQYLLAEIRKVNQQGLSSGIEINHRSSSGCPAANLAPFFNGSAEDTEHLNLLAISLKKEIGELLKTRQRSVIQDGLNRQAQIFEEADRFLQEAARQ